jgi:hypothetical protein
MERRLMATAVETGTTVDLTWAGLVLYMGMRGYKGREGERDVAYYICMLQLVF